MKRILTFILVSGLALSLSAQTQTSYFVENSTLRHVLNPAFAPHCGYVGFPFLSNIQVGTYGNLGARNFLFPLENGKLGLFLNENVTSEQFLNTLKPNNFLDLNLKYDILDAGWYGRSSNFWSLNLGIRTDVNTSIPMELFSFLKNGMDKDPQRYTIEKFSLGARAYSDLSLGFSTDFGNAVDGLRFGARLHLLFGLADARLNIDKMDVSMSSELWKITSNASGYLYGGGLGFTKDENGYVNNLLFEPSSLGLAGVGGALDLGLEYTISEGTPVDGMRFSFAITDLGFVSYFQKTAHKLFADGEVTYQGFENIDPEANMDEQINRLTDDLLKMASFSEEMADRNESKLLGGNVRFGVDYTFLNDRMNVGVLYSGKFNGIHHIHEVTFAYNYSPADWFNVAVSYSLLNTRSTLGWLLTFAPYRGLNFFLGSDYTNLYYTPQGLPVNSSFMTLNLGISIPLGKSIPKI